MSNMTGEETDLRDQDRFARPLCMATWAETETEHWQETAEGAPGGLNVMHVKLQTR